MWYVIASESPLKEMNGEALATHWALQQLIPNDKSFIITPDQHLASFLAIYKPICKI